MAKVMINCPKKKPVYTGIDLDQVSFETTTLVENSVECPYCGESHVWDKKDAYLE